MFRKSNRITILIHKLKHCIISSKCQVLSVSFSKIIWIKITNEQSKPISSGKWFQLGLLNCRSIVNKDDIINVLTTEHSIDSFALTETWTNAVPFPDSSACTPDGYSFTDQPRVSGRGGGIGLLLSQSVHRKPIKVPSYNSFEVLALSLQLPNRIIKQFIIYRPPPSAANGYTFTQFIDEFTDVLAYANSTHQNCLIVGDFNIHVDNPLSSEGTRFNELLIEHGFIQHVSFPTHTKGHTLDLVITQRDSMLVHSVDYTDPCISDHRASSRY